MMFNAVRGMLAGSLLYSWKLNPQTVFFLGYADSYVDDDVLTGLIGVRPALVYENRIRLELVNPLQSPSK